MANSLVKSSLIYGLGSFASRSLGIILIPLYTQYLAVSEYGALSLLNLLLQVVSYLCVLGVGTASMRAYYDEGIDEHSRRQVYGNALTLMLVLPAAVVIVLIPLMRTFVESTIAGLEFYPFVLIVLAVGLFHGPIKLIEGLLRVQDRAVAYISFHTGLLVFQALLIVIALAVLKLGLLGQVLSQLLANSVFAAVAVMLLWKYNPPCFNSQIIKRLLLFGIPLVPYFFFTWSNRAAGSFILGNVGDLAQVGLFALAAQFSGLLTQASTALDNAMMPEFLRRAGDKATPLKLGRLVSQYIAVLGLIGLLLVIVAHPLIQILTNENYYSAYEFVPLLMVAAWLFTINQALTWNFIHSENTGILSLLRGLTAAALLVYLLLLVGILELGALGVAYSMIAANITNIVLTYLFGKASIVMSIPPREALLLLSSMGIGFFALTLLPQLTNGALVYLGQGLVLVLTYFLLSIVLELPRPAQVLHGLFRK